DAQRPVPLGGQLHGCRDGLARLQRTGRGCGFRRGVGWFGGRSPAACEDEDGGGTEGDEADHGASPTWLSAPTTHENGARGYRAPSKASSGRGPDRWKTRTNRHSPHPDHGCGEVDEAEEVDGEPVVAGGEAAEVLELCEAAL